MIKPVIQKKVRNAFSRAAPHYDTLAGLQGQIAEQLLRRINGRGKCRHVLDVGMGTGRIMRGLKDVFPKANVIGIDCASGMVRVAKKKDGGLKVIQADAARLPFTESVFDLVVSNAAYQWIDDLEGAFKDCFRSMRDGGELRLSMFGRRTLSELFLSLEQAAQRKNGARISIQRLSNPKDVEKALYRAGFRNISVSTELRKNVFQDALSLVRWIKGIGANAVRKDFYFGKDLLQEADQIYKEKFKERLGVSATFEVIWGEAHK